MTDIVDTGHSGFKGDHHIKDEAGYLRAQELISGEGGIHKTTPHDPAAQDKKLKNIRERFSGHEQQQAATAAGSGESVVNMNAWKEERQKRKQHVEVKEEGGAAAEEVEAGRTEAASQADGGTRVSSFQETREKKWAQAKAEEVSQKRSELKDRLTRELFPFDNAKPKVQIGGGLDQFELNVTMVNGKITEIPEVAEYIKTSGAKHLTVTFPMAENSAQFSLHPMSISVEELSKKSLLDIMVDAAEKHGEELQTPLKAALKTLSKEEGFSQRISRMSAMDKGFAAVNAVLAGLFLFEAVKDFSRMQEEDPVTGEKKTNWSNVTWGTVNAALSGLSAVLVANALKGTPIR